MSYLRRGAIRSVAALSHLITSSARRSSVAATAQQENPCVLLIWFRHTASGPYREERQGVLLLHFSMCSFLSLELSSPIPSYLFSSCDFLWYKWLFHILHVIHKLDKPFFTSYISLLINSTGKYVKLYYITLIVLCPNEGASVACCVATLWHFHTLTKKGAVVVLKYPYRELGS